MAAIRVYVNAYAVDVPEGATALDAIEAFDALLAASIRAGDKMLTDSRGLPAAVDFPLHNGAIFRIVRARQPGDDEDLSAT